MMMISNQNVIDNYIFLNFPPKKIWRWFCLFLFQNSVNWTHPNFEQCYKTEEQVSIDPSIKRQEIMALITILFNS